MKLRTEMLKDMLSKAVKGSSDNKLIPITSLLKIEVQDGVIHLETTDATNYLYVYGNTESEDSIYAVVNTELFARLISKTTSEFVELKLADNIPLLQVTGNGSYTIEMPLDENGMLVQYPNPLQDLTLTDIGVINKSAVDDILTSVKPSLATTYENPCYIGYYAGDSVIATDVYKIARLDHDLFNGQSVLVSPKTMDLLGIFTEEKIRIGKSEDKFVFQSKDIILYSPELAGKEDFAVTEIEALLDMEFPNNCQLPKSDLISVLDRLALFINPYDKNAIKLTFTNSGLQISSKSESGVEVIKYIGNQNFTPFVCEVDVEMLLQEVKAIPSETVELHYGLDNAIKLINGDLTIIIALLE